MQAYQSTYRIIALLLAFLVFFSSAGIAMDIHYCQGEFKSISFIGKAKSCHEIAQQKASCPHHQKQQEKSCSAANEKDCCDNEVLYFQSDQDQQIAAADLMLTKTEQQFILACSFLLFADRYCFDADQRVPVPEYSPPIIPRDISVLFETFLL
jgi:hypothetical protein